MTAHSLRRRILAALGYVVAVSPVVGVAVLILGFMAAVALGTRA